MIHSYRYCSSKIKDTGEVVGVKGGLAVIKGFKGGMIGEGIAFEDNKKGMSVLVEEDKTMAVVFDREPIEVGLAVARTDRPLRVSVGSEMLGESWSALGYIKEGTKDPSSDVESREIEAEAWNLDRREKITKFLQTGVAMVDLIIPLGEGQRELLVGDQKTGKTHFLLKTMMTQARLGKICVLALIGKQRAEISKIEEMLKKEKLINKFIIVESEADASAGEIFLTPYTAMSMAEHFKEQGKDVMIGFDDLTTHAQYFREISLLAGRLPGRESYPGDVFYTQAKLLERAGNFLVKDKPVSITALGIAKTLAQDLSSYIPTNLMSITDGHLFFDKALELKGVRPAVNLFLSVTRVGRQTQPKELRELGSKALSVLKKRQELERYLRFGAEITTQVKATIDKGDKLMEFFNQTGEVTYTPDEIVKKVGGVLNA